MNDILEEKTIIDIEFNDKPESEINKSDLTINQKRMTNNQKVLKLLQENSNEISNEELSKGTGINKSNIPREIKKLEDQGYIISKRYEQVGRKKSVYFKLTSRQNKMTNNQELKDDIKSLNTPSNVEKTDIKEEPIQEEILDHSNRTVKKPLRQYSDAFMEFWPLISKSISSMFKARKWAMMHKAWKIIKSEVEANF